MLDGALHGALIRIIGQIVLLVRRLQDARDILIDQVQVCLLYTSVRA